jgi:glutamine---fructose-6-phosphate transaminase (isomerizing)
MFHEKLVSNIQEIKARKGRVIAVISEGDSEIEKMADDVMFIPESDELVSPLLSVIPLQLFACYLGMAKGFDVDKPRNLAKSVTVE